MSVDFDWPMLAWTVETRPPGAQNVSEPDPLHPLTHEIVQAVPDVAAALAELDSAEKILSDLSLSRDELHDAYDAALVDEARTGKPRKTDPYWQARVDEINDRHSAQMVVATEAHRAVLRVAAPHVDEFIARDRARILAIADELSVLIGRATRYIGNSGIVDGFARYGTVDEILNALRVVARA